MLSFYEILARYGAGGRMGRLFWWKPQGVEEVGKWDEAGWRRSGIDACRNSRKDGFPLLLLLLLLRFHVPLHPAVRSLASWHLMSAGWEVGNAFEHP